MFSKSCSVLFALVLVLAMGGVAMATNPCNVRQNVVVQQVVQPYTVVTQQLVEVPNYVVTQKIVQPVRVQQVRVQNVRVQNQRSVQRSRSVIRTR